MVATCCLFSAAVVHNNTKAVVLKNAGKPFICRPMCKNNKERVGTKACKYSEKEEKKQKPFKSRKPNFVAGIKLSGLCRIVKQITPKQKSFPLRFGNGRVNAYF